MPMTRFPKVKEVLYEACLDIICDKGHTPHIEVFTGHPDFIGPRDYESPQQLTVFNIGGKALATYDMNSKGISFGAKFGGVHTDVFVPWDSLARIFAKEDTTLLQNFAINVTGKEEIVKKEPKIKLVHSNDNPQPSGEIRKPFRPVLVKTDEKG